MSIFAKRHENQQESQVTTGHSICIMGNRLIEIIARTSL